MWWNRIVDTGLDTSILEIFGEVRLAFPSEPRRDDRRAVRRRDRPESTRSPTFTSASRYRAAKKRRRALRLSSFLNFNDRIAA
jgi:hypothetical protein